MGGRVGIAGAGSLGLQLMSPIIKVPSKDAYFFKRATEHCFDVMALRGLI